jgi:hypothetical protein
MVRQALKAFLATSAIRRNLMRYQSLYSLVKKRIVTVGSLVHFVVFELAQCECLLLHHQTRMSLRLEWLLERRVNK